MIQDLFQELMLPHKEKTESECLSAFCVLVVFFKEKTIPYHSNYEAAGLCLVTQLVLYFPQLSFFCAIINNNMSDGTST